jgi:hypothetical protein
MAYKFQQGEPVYHTSTPEAPNVTGFYTVQHVGTDGMIYRLIDKDGNYTDANEDEITHLKYGLFARIPEGWPIIVPMHIKDLYVRFLQSTRYRLVEYGPIATMLERQTEILIKLEDEQATG